jgi:hypothetical protein
MNNNRYRCIVNGCSPTATSSAVTLSVFTAPAVTQQPVSLSVCEPASASFSVTASGSGTLYQWQVSTDGGVNYGNISGATAATYTIASVTIALNNNRYRCLVSNAGCTTPIITSPAILTVSSVPTILTQPANQTVCLGSNGSLCVSASGTGLAYQWQMASTCSGPWNNVTGGTSSCLTITNPAVTAFYRCVVSSPCASAVNSACAELRVVQPVVISTQPIATELCSGSPATFAISATSSLPITYQWQSSTDGLTWSNLSNAGVYTGVSTPTLGISSAGISLNGIRYRCQMGNGACPTPIFSNAALLTVRQLPVVTLNAAPLTSLLPGKTTTLTATPSGATGGTQTLSWFLNGTAISQTGTTRTVNVEQVGSYRVRLSETYSSGLTCSAQSADVVINATESDKLFIFPSPNDGRFTVSYYNISVTASQRRIVITDSEGKKVYDRLFAVSGPYTLLNIDLRSASRGIYVVQVGDAAGTRLATGKVHVR